MKIFSQSTACAFFAVANGLTQHDPDLVWKMTQSWLCYQNPESPWCPPANPRPNVRKEIQLYGGWDLPVPRYQMSARNFSRGCNMSQRTDDLVEFTFVLHSQNRWHLYKGDGIFMRENRSFWLNRANHRYFIRW